MDFREYIVEITFSYESTSGYYLINRGRSGPSYHQNFGISLTPDGTAIGQHEKCDDNTEQVFTDPLYPLNDGLFHTTTLTYDGTWLRIYRDGALDDSTPADPPCYGGGAPWEVVIGASGEKGSFFEVII